MKFILVFLILFSVNIISYSQNVMTDNVRVTSTFGEFRGDHFHNGVDFGGYKKDIYPIKNGEISFYFDQDENPTRQIFGVGSVMFIEHEDDLRSYYYHIDPGSIEKQFAKVTEKDVVALTGNSGRSAGGHLHLTIEDKKEGIVVDPLNYLNLDKNSEQKPLIAGIYLRTENNLIQIRNRMSMRYNGEIKLFVKAYDLLGGIPMGLKNVKIYINDELSRAYDFTYFIKRNNTYYIAPEYRFEEVYGVDPHYYRGGIFTPKPGLYNFKAEIIDFDDKIVVLERSVIFR